jgi:hypothetical protein
LRLEDGATLTFQDGAVAQTPMPFRGDPNPTQATALLVNRGGNVALSAYVLTEDVLWRQVDVENASGLMTIVGTVRGTGGEFRAGGRVRFMPGSSLSSLRQFTLSGEVDLAGNPLIAPIWADTFQSLPGARFFVRDPISGHLLVRTQNGVSAPFFTSNVPLLPGPLNIRIA